MKNDEKIKHLEFIQGVINRLANNSFLIKGWLITITLAGLSFYLTQKKTTILPILLATAILFWFLDSYYLRQERLFRRLYADVVKGKIEPIFDMDVSRYQDKIQNSFATMFSYPNCFLYIAIIALILVQIVLSLKIEISIKF
ncbi:MAG: hypothetical protein WC536_01070 [Patescibacteria group bacterium]